jgi:p-cumate 2,3-dioxygenase subunit alpha
MRRLVRDDSQASVPSFSVDQTAYTDPDVYERERERVFAHSWLYFAHESEVPTPGSFLARSLCGRPLVLTRDLEGALHVVENTCAHRGARVCQEHRGTARVFQCPYHLWTYELDGRLRAVPDDERYATPLDRAVLGLRRPRMDVYRGFVFVAFDAEVGALTDHLGGAREYLDLVCDQSEQGFEVIPGTYDLDLNANWKLLAENTLDGYHLDKLHRRVYTAYAAEGRGALRRDGGAFALGGGHAVIELTPPVRRLTAFWAPPWPESLRPTIEARRIALEQKFGVARAHKMTQTNRILLVFPNLLVLDGESGNVWLRAFEPASTSLTHIRMQVIAPRGEEAAERTLRLREALRFSGPAARATPDDIEVMESCQRGFNNSRESDVSRGLGHDAQRHVDEVQMRGFWTHWQALLGDDR